jgi:general secretion pathway protein H
MADRRQRDSGVTLIEVLVVLALIGVSAGVVSYAIPSGRADRDLRQEAELLTARLNLAAERSLVEGRRYRLNWEGSGYSFEEWTEAEWRTTTPPFDAPHRLAGDTRLRQTGGAATGALRITPDLLPPEEGALHLRLAAGESSLTVIFDGAAARLSGG